MRLIDFFKKLFGTKKGKGNNANELAVLPPEVKDNELVVSPPEAKDNEKYVRVTQIDAIRGKDVISFNKISINDIQKYNYQEINSDRVKGGLSNVISAGSQIAAVSALNPNGLFSATVSPQLLTTFANGTFSTMIHEGGQIAAHAGFQSISAAVFAPIAIMQLMSMVTGQYYMNGITKQLKSIDKKINELIKFHHTEKIAKLENSQELIQQLCNIQYPGIEHLNQLKTVENEVGSIFREYKKYLEDSNLVKSNIEDIVSYFDSQLFFSSQKYLDKLFSLDDDSGFSLNLYMVAASDELLHLIPIIEFMLNVKINQIDNSRNYQIDELYQNISRMKEEDFFVYSSGQQMLEKYYAPFITEAKKMVSASWFHKEESKSRLKIMQNRKKALKSEVLGNVETLNIKTKLVEQMTKPIEILYSIGDDDKSVVYVKQ